MATFTFSAAKKTGEIMKGDREAENEKILAQTLKTEGLFLLEAKAKSGGSLLSLGGDFGNIGDLISKIMPIGIVDKMFFTRNLGVMINAGLSLTKAMDALIEQSTNAKFRKILSEINNSVIKGTSLADSLRPHEQVFGPLFIHMVEAGEASGKLTLILKLLANQMKKDYDIRRRVKGALMYPAIIIIALVGIGILMMVYVVPTLITTIKELNVEIPLSTKIIIFTSDMLLNYSLWVALGAVVAMVAFWRVMKTTTGKEIFDKYVLKFPLFGPLIKKFNSARFTRMLAYLITSGVPIVKSLDICAKVLGNSMYQKAIAEAAVEIQKGKQLNEILKVHKEIFDPVVIQMLKVGEETGKISSLILRIALFFEEDVTETTKNLSTIIEPILMVFIGAIVGFFAVSMLQPIYSSVGNL